MKSSKLIGIALTAIIIICTLAFLFQSREIKENVHPTENRPVLSVVMTRAQKVVLPIRVPATGNIAAWQETSIRAEGDGLKLIEVSFDVGDTVKRGQVLARFNHDIIATELAEAQSSVTKSEAAIIEAELNFTRAKALESSQAISTQQLDQIRVATLTARAQLEAARAIEKKHRLRKEQTIVLSPSDGIITSRTANVGTVVTSAQELFRLIKNGRLEWRAVVAAADIEKLAPKQTVIITTQNHQVVQGTLRMVAPTIDTGTQNGLVYVDVPQNTALRAGAFVRGYIEIGDVLTLTLPQSAVILRDGFHYVMQLSSTSTVILKKVTVGRQADNHIEITAGLEADESVIASGLSFLSEGDTVRVVSTSSSNTYKNSHAAHKEQRKESTQTIGVTSEERK